MRLAVTILVLASLLLSGCGEENAAKVAPWIGTNTINESKADAFATMALQKASGCRRLKSEIEKVMECIRPAVEDAMTADKLYIRDCEFGNSRACRKRTEFHSKWDEEGAKNLPAEKR